MLSVAAAIDRALIAAATDLSDAPTTFITGGDATALTEWLETKAQYRANLVLEGLAVIAAED